jgi:hypothetical protein
MVPPKRRKQPERYTQFFLPQIHCSRRHPCRLKIVNFFIKDIAYIKHLEYIFYEKVGVYQLLE